MPTLPHLPARRLAAAALAALPACPPVALAQGAGPAAPSLLPHDLSPVGMFMAADIVVKAVMLGLIAASVVTWTILLVKACEVALANRRVARAAARIEMEAGLHKAAEAVGAGAGVVTRMLRSAIGETRRLTGPVAQEGLQQRVSSLLADRVAQAGRNMSVGTGILATIGSTAPFVGLFGTVWGIMNAFIGISEAQTTNLAVVAPGIAEALLATALGLVAAIPAVVAYNFFARAITGYRHGLHTVAAGIERQLSRDLDAGRIGGRRDAGGQSWPA